MGIKARKRGNGPKLPASLVREIADSSSKGGNIVGRPQSHRKNRQQHNAQGKHGTYNDKNSDDDDNNDAYSDLDSDSDGGLTRIEDPEGFADSHATSDEEIDSDAAFDSDDERRFEGWQFGKQKNSADSLKEPSNEHSDSQSESNDNEGLVDLSEALDQETYDGDSNVDNDDNDGSDGSKGSDDNDDNQVSDDTQDLADQKKRLNTAYVDEKRKKVRFSLAVPNADDDDDSDENSYSDYDGDEHSYSDASGGQSESDDASGSDSDSEDGDDGNETQDRPGLSEFIDMLEQKKKHKEKPAKPIRSDADLYIAESEYAYLPSSKTLKIDDMIASLSSNEAALASIKDLKRETSSERYRRVEPALPRIMQERLERKAAREIADSEIKNWSDIVTANRRADHLHFPINEKPPPKISSHSLIADFKPRDQISTESLSASQKLESDIFALLKEAGVKSDRDIEALEELEMNHLSKEEVRRRRDELRYARELMFRHEIKARRAAKIKSRTYRKMMRKDKQKMREALKGHSEAGQPDQDHQDQQDHSDGNSIDGDEVLAEEERLHAEEQRAVERMTQRRRNTAQNVQQLQKRNENLTRMDIEQQLDDEDELERQIKGTEFEKSTAQSEEDTKFPEKGLFAMKFMQNAIRAKERAATAIADRDDTGDGTSGSSTSVSQGRKTFGPRKANDKVASTDGKRDKTSFNEILPTNVVKRSDNVFALGRAIKVNREIKADMSNEIQNSESPTIGISKSEGTNSKLQSDSSKLESDITEDNPWLDLENTEIERSVISENMSKAQKSALKLRNARRSAMKKDSDQDTVQDTVQDKYHDGDGDAKDRALPMNGTLQKFDDQDDEDDQDSDFDQQRALVREAFAVDNVFAEFQREREEEILDDAPKVVDETLPGWGSWVGKGVSAKPVQQQRKKVTPGIAPSDRKDAKHSNVIISEKKVKKAAVYFADKVPFPYENREQYNLAMRGAIGPEWNTRKMFNRAVKPRILARQGTVIEPLKRGS